jgi:lariat debranching enzyme
LFELHYGGWVAPNIYYLGAANTIRFGPLRISGMSGIWKGYDYRKPHYERLPYNRDDVSSIYHVREVDVRKLLQIRTQVDIGLSHDWPKGIEKYGDFEKLFRKKQGFRADSDSGRLGSVAAREVLDYLRPKHWFSAHLHVRFAAEVHHNPHPAEMTTLKPGEAHVDVAVAETGPASTVPRSNIDTSALAGHRLLGSAVGDEKSRVAAWQNFGTVARQNELADAKTFMKAFKERKASDPPRDIKFNETAKIGRGPIQKFIRGADGARVEETTVDGDKIGNDDKLGQGNSPVNRPSAYGSSEKGLPLVHNVIEAGIKPATGGNSKGGPVFNADQVDIATSPSSSSGTHVPVEKDISSIFKTIKDFTEDVSNADKISLATSPESAASMNSPPAQKVLPKADIALNWDKDRVQNDWWTAGEDELVGALKKELPTTLEKPHVSANVAKTLPAPADITNTVTNFLTLDKPHSRDPFVELLEIKPISNQKGALAQRPFKLKYDAEWLAITRVFADELDLGGNPNDSVPRHQGHEYYQERLAQEERWVSEHITKKGLLDIPENFVPTAPVHDVSVSVETHEQPREYPNPQTAAFCDLLKIHNKFAMTDEEVLARMEAGPRREQHAGRSRGGARGGRGDRGRGRGRGRGGRGGAGGW